MMYKDILQSQSCWNLLPEASGRNKVAPTLGVWVAGLLSVTALCPQVSHSNSFRVRTVLRPPGGGVHSTSSENGHQQLWWLQTSGVMIHTCSDHRHSKLNVQQCSCTRTAGTSVVVFAALTNSESRIQDPGYPEAHCPELAISRAAPDLMSLDWSMTGRCRFHQCAHAVPFWTQSTGPPAVTFSSIVSLCGTEAAVHVQMSATHCLDTSNAAQPCSRQLPMTITAACSANTVVSTNTQSWLLGHISLGKPGHAPLQHCLRLYRLYSTALKVSNCNNLPPK
jgi:hypothetical protein